VILNKHASNAQPTETASSQTQVSLVLKTQPVTAAVCLVPAKLFSIA